MQHRSPSLPIGQLCSKADSLGGQGELFVLDLTWLISRQNVEANLRLSGIVALIPPAKLEVNAGVDGDGPRSRNARRMLGDTPESGGVDIGIRVVPYRPVQHIHSIGTNRERRLLTKPSPFLQGHIEAEAGRPFNAGQRQSEGSRFTRLRVLKDDISCAVDNDVVAEAVSHGRTSAKVWRRCPLNGQTFEVFDEPILLPDLSEAIRQSADQIRSINTVSRSAIASAVESPPRRRDAQRLAAVPGEDSRNVPTLNDSVNPTGSSSQQRPVGTERQFP